MTRQRTPPLLPPRLRPDLPRGPRWRPSKRKIDEDCTLAGSISQICVALFIKVEDGVAAKGPRASRTEDEALRCILIAAGHVASPRGEYRDTESAVSFIAGGEDETPHGKECVRATNLAVGNESWQQEGSRRKDREVWAKQMRETVEKTFRKKCGVHAALDGSSFANLAIERVSSSTKVFYEGKDGTGSHVVVRCGGQITMRSPGGSTMKMMARTWNQQAKDLDEVQCLQACANKNLVCLQHNKNITNPECRSACEPSCT